MQQPNGTVLLADVGGTNCRIALSGGPGTLSHVTRFVNAEYDSFYDVLARFSELHDTSRISSCCVAIAGPVASGGAKLTNRNWLFSPAAIAAGFPLMSEHSVVLINDLAALGYALPHLAQAQLDEIFPATTEVAANNQALVVGLGTGFNVCLTMQGQTGPVVMEAELGHASLPCIVAERLRDEIGSGAARFQSSESLFSGRGMSQLYAFFSDGKPSAADAVLANYLATGTGPAFETVTVMNRLLGVFARELMYQYLPFAGLHFAGGVARGLLGSEARSHFLTEFTATGRLADRLQPVPVRVITDDGAALTGAAWLLSRRMALNTAAR